MHYSAEILLLILKRDVNIIKNNYKRGTKIMVKVYRDETRQELIGVVNYNENLDYYDGRNFQNGGFGYHKGLTKLKNGSHVIIIGSNWEGVQDYAYVVSDKEALQEIIESNNLELLENGRFKKLRELYEEIMIIEEEE